MDNELENIRDIWVSAFFNGQYEILEQYEEQNFKVVYEEDGRIESNFTRYERIAHAVNNGVWKPQKLNVEFEEYEYDREQKNCRIVIGVEHSGQQLQELWQFDEQWKIVELRFLKQKRAR